MERSTRRAVLSLAVGGLIGVAGCGSRTDDGGETIPPAATPTDSPVTTTTSPETTVPSLSPGETAVGPDAEVRVSAPRVRRLVRSIESGPSSTHPYPAGREDAQFLVLDVAAEGLEEPSLQVAFDDEVTRLAQFRVGGRNSTTLGLLVPVEQAEAADRMSVVWEADQQYRWRLPGEVVDHLARPPRFRVRSFEVSDLRVGEPFAATLRVENVGQRAGEFLARLVSTAQSGLALADPSVLVERGATAERDVTGRSLFEAEAPETTVVFYHGTSTHRVTAPVSER